MNNVDQRITDIAFRFHLAGGPGHMYRPDMHDDATLYNPMMIFPDQCPCLMKAQAQMASILAEEAKKRQLQDELDHRDFNNLFEPRQA